MYLYRVKYKEFSAIANDSVELEMEFSAEDEIHAINQLLGHYVSLDDLKVDFIEEVKKVSNKSFWDYFPIILSPEETRPFG